MKKIKSLSKEICWRVLKATLVGLATFLFIYFVPTLLFQISALPAEYAPLYYIFVAIMVFFAVAIELFSKTIIHHALKIARTLVLMAFFVYSFNGGIVAVDVEMVHVVADLRVLLGMIILINFIGLARNVIGTINFLSVKSELPPEKA